MSKLLITFFLLCTLFTNAQNNYWSKFNADTTLVRAYINKDSADVLLHESFDKSSTAQKLGNSSKYHWYLLQIKRVKKDWAQIQNVFYVPSFHSDTIHSKIQNHWIALKHLSVDLPQDSLDLYKKPNGKYTTHFVQFAPSELIDVRGNWAKVKIKLPKSESDSQSSDASIVIGWINWRSQCGVPWTTCNW